MMLRTLCVAAAVISFVSGFTPSTLVCGAGRRQGLAACVKLPLTHVPARVRANAGVALRMSETVLYGSRGSRSPLVEWYLHEIGQPYTHQEERDGLPNPFGQIPALRDGPEVEIFESGAILLYLADKYGEGKTPEIRASYTKWVMWANSALDKSLFSRDIASRAPPLLSILNEVLKGKEYLAGDEFSVADVAVASYLLFIPMFHPNYSLAPFPNVVKYMGRCVEREGYAKAFGPQAAQQRTGWVAAQGGEKKKSGFFG